MAKALVTAQIQSVREIKKKATIKKTNKKITVFVLALLISLILLYVAYLSYTYYVANKYEYKESELGISFYSKEYGVRNAIHKILDTPTILVSYNVPEINASNTESITDSIVLFNYIFPANNIKIITLINNIDNKGRIINCSTNEGDIYTHKVLLSIECNELIKSSHSVISIDFPNPNLKETTVFVNPKENTILFKPKTKNDLVVSTYLLLKSKYPNLEEILLKVEEIKKTLGDTILADLNKSQDSNDFFDSNN